MGGEPGAATGPRVGYFQHQPEAPVHGLKPIFFGLSLALVVLGLTYLGLGTRGLAQHEARAGVLLGLGLGAAAVGAALWLVVRRMGKQQ